MPHTHIVTEKIIVDGRTIGTSSLSITSGSGTTIDETIAIAAADLQLTLNVDVSDVKSFIAIADQALTLETNSGGSPANTITLAADVPYYWRVGHADAFKLTTDVTALFVTNASGVAARLQIEILFDPTP